MILAIDIGGSKMMAGLVDGDGKARQKKIWGLAPNITQVELLETVLMLSRSVMAEESGVKIDAVGVTIPGLADAKRGIWLYACFSGIENFPIADILSRDLHLPVFISNDVNACAYGEMAYGACRENRDFMWVTVSNGIGGGLVLDGRIYEGAEGCSGEIGHVIVAEKGNPCDCGNCGCLEAHASGRAIVRDYLAKSGVQTTSESTESVNAKQVAERARAGELAAIQAYREAGYYLGKAIAGAVNVINPEKVILGGGVSLAHDLFMPELKATVDQMAFKAANRRLVIVPTGLRYDAALLGAAAIARQQLKEMREWIADYINSIANGVRAIEVEQIEDLLEILRRTNLSRKRIFVIGNGGSAATANHFTCDFGKNAVQEENNRFKIISLCENVSYITAYGNDIDYEHVYVEQLKNLLEEGDLLLAISASGNSPNIIRAVEFAREKGNPVVGMTGFNGGKLGVLSDIHINIDLPAIEQVEDLHLMVLHIIVFCFKKMDKAI